jgi:hypothetical protein
LFLLLVALLAASSLWINGMDYYESPPAERAFMGEHRDMRPSGSFSHGLGVIGAAMILVGVTLYSSRKRIRTLWSLGKLSIWLEVHITLCLLGPILIIYHTTFKAGGIAAISLWTMLSVAASGIVGRFLYILIPRSASGVAMDRGQIDEEFDRISAVLLQSDVGKKILNELDKRYAEIRRPSSLRETIRCFLLLQRLKVETNHWIARALKPLSLSHEVTHHIRRAAIARARLLQRSILLLQVEKLFYYWHAIHMPFTVIMFITLAIHVGVALWLGYTWVF